MKYIGRWSLAAILTPCLIAAQALSDETAASRNNAAARAGGSELVVGATTGIASGIYNPIPLMPPPVPIPDGAFERPDRIYVLPVLVAPSDYGQWLPDPNAPGLNLNGDPFVGSPNPFSESYKVRFERARHNLSVHLQTARLMYEQMMRNPLNADKRGTFRLADWDAAAGVARNVPLPSKLVDPLIIKLENYDRNDIVALNAIQPWATPHWVEEILDRIGCQRMSCPFVLAIAVVGDPFNPVHGAKWNYGYNNGGGAAFFNYTTVLDSWNTSPGSSHNFLSTLVHELGHAFGLPHSEDYCAVEVNCAAIPRLDNDASASIMSYNLDNRIYGCPRTSALDPTYCLLPTAATVASLPGVLEREDKRILDANKLVFPNFNYQPALDHPSPTDVAYSLDAGGDWEITTSGRLYVDSPDSNPATTRPSVLIGGFSETILEIEEQDFLRTWVSTEGAFGGWAQYHIYFPDTVTLQRLRVYGGHAGDNDRPTGLQLFVAGDANPIATAYNLVAANNELNTNRAGSHFILQTQRGSSGLVRLRGLRFFGKPAGSTQTMEFYPPAEPTASTQFGSTFGGSIDNVVGSDQLVASASLPFQAHASWHSSQRVPGSWVSVDVEFAKESVLRGISVNTGHTNGVHRATQIQIERECVCRQPYSGQGGSCATQSVANCNAAGGIGQRVYEIVFWEPNAVLNDFVAFPDTTARRWRIALKTLDGAPGSDSWMVVRGLRFWAAGTLSTYELYPPRGTIP